jgi:hypothetical protein
MHDDLMYNLRTLTFAGKKNQLRRAKLLWHLLDDNKTLLT